MGIGVVISAHGFPTMMVTEFCGEGTCHQAVYHALLRGFDECRANPHITDIVVYSSSALLLGQMDGAYTVRDPQLQQLHARATVLRHEFSTCRFVFLRGTRNTEAKALAREAWSNDREAARQTNLIEETGAQP
jgi:ribonuclease HI